MKTKRLFLNLMLQRGQVNVHPGEESLFTGLANVWKFEVLDGTGSTDMSKGIHEDDDVKGLVRRY